MIIHIKCLFMHIPLLNRCDCRKKHKAMAHSSLAMRNQLISTFVSMLFSENDKNITNRTFGIKQKYVQK